MAQRDLDLVAGIDAIPRLLEVVCQSTGMGFAAVARVTQDRWIALAVKDMIGFGLQPGGELELATTICDEIRCSGNRVVIDDVARDPDYRDHPTPRMYGFRSYISVPITLNGEFYGTLCAIDPSPRSISEGPTVKTFELFAELIGMHLEQRAQLAETSSALVDEKSTGELREQFIAVLGHDLRNPLAALTAGARALAKEDLSPRGGEIVRLMQESAKRMLGLTTDILDFARGRLDGGMPLRIVGEIDLAGAFRHVVAELRAVHPDSHIEATLDIEGEIQCDAARLSQLLSNLLGNALAHGDPHGLVEVSAQTANGRLILSVRNRGETIPGPVAKSLFKPFAKRRSASAGLGLGLFIASEIARTHGGKLSVQSADGVTTFSADVAVSAETYLAQTA